MNIKYKKRIIGFLLLVGIALIFIPLFFGRSVPEDELKLSARIPQAPPKPHDISVPIPPAEATLPAVATATKPPATTPAVAQSASSVVFEQIQSTDNTATPATPSAKSPAPSSAATSTSNLSTSVKASPITSPPVANITSASTAAANATATNPAPITEPVTTTTKSTDISLATTKNTHKNATNLTNPTAWAIQVGSFSDKINAQAMMKKLQMHSFTAYIHTTKTANGDFIRVLVGPELRRSDAEQVLVRLQKELNIQGIIVKAMGS